MEQVAGRDRARQDMAEARAMQQSARTRMTTLRETFFTHPLPAEDDVTRKLLHKSPSLLCVLGRLRVTGTVEFWVLEHASSRVAGSDTARGRLKQ